METKTICICKSCREENYKGKRARSLTFSTCEICGLKKNCVYIKVNLNKPIGTENGNKI